MVVFLLLTQSIPSSHSVPNFYFFLVQFWEGVSVNLSISPRFSNLLPYNSSLCSLMFLCISLVSVSLISHFESYHFFLSLSSDLSVLRILYQSQHIFTHVVIVFLVFMFFFIFLCFQ